ncbi:MAG: hydrogenase nickel incorporation protein HypB [Erysipelotrichaceae bacterium]|nr:hydrogenase nickel incorporation protein HypB [Erysipelotrichaceae bacterium]
MEEIRIIEVKQSVFAANDRKADELRQQLKEKGTFLLNVMSSPGSGKTTALSKIINILKKDYQIGVMEADIDSDVDARTISSLTGVETIQLHTGGMCHLDAGMTAQGIDSLEDKHYDLIILENVGNLVCPAEFDTGSIANMCILSVPEGDDKPLKYPLMFEVSNFVLINKIDVLPYFDFDVDKCKENIRYRNGMADIFEICAKDGRGIEEVAEYIRKLIEDWRK